MRPQEWDDALDRRIAAIVAQRSIDREVRRRIKARRFKRELAAITFYFAVSLLCIGSIYWAIWG